MTYNRFLRNQMPVQPTTEIPDRMREELTGPQHIQKVGPGESFSLVRWALGKGPDTVEDQNYHAPDKPEPTVLEHD
jgi:hypothetical protein